MNDGLIGSQPAFRAPRDCRAVVLVGFMGAGKTSVGRALAEQLGWPFEDLDDRIQVREGRTVEQIFAESGESEFRTAEHEALRDLLAGLIEEPRVIALGGGAFVQKNNADLLQRTDVLSVFLDAPAEELFRRCEQEGTDRPLRRSSHQFSELYESRRGHYLAASVRIDTSGKNIAAVAAEVVSRLGPKLQSRVPKEL
jgi:shikimate kinase